MVLGWCSPLVHGALHNRREHCMALNPLAGLLEFEKLSRWTKKKEMGRR